MKHSIKVERTAHYYTLVPTSEIQSILIVVHGYAQLAKDFIKEFDSLKNTKTLVVAPEALSKFYNKDKKPVANWMTSHEREDEMNDYIQYLNQLVDHIQVNYPKTPISVLGFSQGVSTLLRWLVQTALYITKIHLVAGSVPPELTSVDFDGQRNTSNFYYYYGNRDRLLRPEKAQEQIQRLSQMNLTVESITFDGRHEIPRICISRLIG